MHPTNPIRIFLNRTITLPLWFYIGIVVILVVESVCNLISGLK